MRCVPLAMFAVLLAQCGNAPRPDVPRTALGKADNPNAGAAAPLRASLPTTGRLLRPPWPAGAIELRTTCAAGACHLIVVLRLDPADATEPAQPSNDPRPTVAFRVEQVDPPKLLIEGRLTSRGAHAQNVTVAHGPLRLRVAFVPLGETMRASGELQLALSGSISPPPPTVATGADGSHISRPVAAPLGELPYPSAGLAPQCRDPGDVCIAGERCGSLECTCLGASGEQHLTSSPSCLWGYCPDGWDVCTTRCQAAGGIAVDWRSPERMLCGPPHLPPDAAPPGCRADGDVCLLGEICSALACLCVSGEEIRTETRCTRPSGSRILRMVETCPPLQQTCAGACAGRGGSVHISFDATRTWELGC